MPLERRPEDPAKSLGACVGGGGARTTSVLKAEMLDLRQRPVRNQTQSHFLLHLSGSNPEGRGFASLSGLSQVRGASASCSLALWGGRQPWQFKEHGGPGKHRTQPRGPAGLAMLVPTAHVPPGSLSPQSSSLLPGHL